MRILRAIQVYNVEKVVLGFFHQGDTRFGATAGVQCACKSSLAFGWSKIRDCRIWQKDELDHVLNEGDYLYKVLDTIDLFQRMIYHILCNYLTWTSILIFYT